MRQTRGKEIRIEVDGQPLLAHIGETVACALAANGNHMVRKSARLAEPRGVFCNMGICYECLVYLEDRAVRACMVEVYEGMKLTSWGPKEEDPS
jgi:aerobic-type carbon monoxide dehydrogenase small subunit (CoxS/CutS family)